MRLTPARRATSVIVVRRTPTASTQARAASSRASSSTVRCDTSPLVVPVSALTMREMSRYGLLAVRYGLPLAMAIGGIVALAIGGDAAGFGVVLLGSAFIVLLINVLF